MNTKMLKCEKIHDSAEHYDTMIWTIFSVGIAFSLYILYIVWPFKTSIGAMQFFISVLGFLVLFYSILLIESFGQKKILMYRLFDANTKGFDIKQRIKKLPFFRVEWMAEMILLFLFLAYVYHFWFVWNNKSLATYGKLIIFLALPIFIISLALLFVVVVNWILRPKSDSRNPLERIRNFLFEKLVKKLIRSISKSIKRFKY